MAGMLALAALLAGVAAALAVRALAMSRVDQLARLAAYGYPRADAAAPRTRSMPARLLDALIGRLGQGARRALLGGSEEAVRRALQGAGLYRTTPAAYAAFRLAAVALALIAVGAAAFAGVSPVRLALLGIVLLACAWFLPPAELKRRRTARLARIDRGLADLVDFLVVTVEAGVAFGSALNAAATRFRPPLGDELRLTMQEQAMGLSTEEALRNLVDRCDTPMMRAFGRSVVQAETLGVSTGQIMRSLAVEMRKRRRQAAEERAHKAPVKIVFPLVFLILPAMFLIILGPAVHDLMRGLGS